MAERSNETLGMECRQIADISDFYKTTLSQKGVKLTSQRGLHAHQIVGNYIVIFQTQQGAWRGGQVTVKDSSRPQASCDSSRRVPSTST